MLGRTANATPELFQPGTRVVHYSGDGLRGTVTELDTNLIEMGYSSTTCKVLWDDHPEPDIEWTNKLIVIEDDDKWRTSTQD